MNDADTRRRLRTPRPRASAALVLHRCSCGRTFTVPEWEALPFVGYHEDEEETLEFRNCSCGSTRAVLVRTS